MSKFKNFNNSHVLECVATTYKLHRALTAKYKVPPLQASIIMLLGAYNEKSENEVLPMTVTMLQDSLGYAKDGKHRIYDGLKLLVEAENAYVQKLPRLGRKGFVYTLTGRGIALIRECLDMIATYRFYLNEFTTPEAA